jgi:uncharacterized protein (TIGR02265 family)
MPSDKNDLAQRLAVCTPDDTVRGFIFKSVYHLVEERAGGAAVERMMQQLRVDKLPIDFFSYPVADFLQLIFLAADVLEPQYGSAEEALRACGASTVTGFFQSYVGNTLLRLVGGGSNPKRALSTVGTVYSTLVSYGSREFVDMGASRVLLTYRGDMQPVYFHEGALFEVLKVLKVNGKVTSNAFTLDHSEYLLEWS